MSEFNTQQNSPYKETIRRGYQEQKELLPLWYEKQSKLEKNDCSRLHLLGEEFISSGNRLPIKNSNTLNSSGLKNYKVFVVQHDWAKAFEGATEYKTNNNIKLPFEQCAFEFRISGNSVIVLTDQSSENYTSIRYLSFVKLDKTWAPIGSDDESINGVPHIVPRLPLKSEPHLIFACSQIKAICVALDAEVAIHEVIRAPHKLNEKRIAKGKLPLQSYHIVNLANRTRSSSTEEPVPTGRHVRLHFRRGHWRHYTNHKTWIHWMLVGDPDLGWIDKEYRL